MATDPHETWYVAKVSFAFADPDGPRWYSKDKSRVRGDDPIYLRCPDNFKPIDPSQRSAPAVEEAVAIPGKKRGD